MSLAKLCRWLTSSFSSAGSLRHSRMMTVSLVYMETSPSHQHIVVKWATARANAIHRVRLIASSGMHHHEVGAGAIRGERQLKPAGVHIRCGMTGYDDIGLDRRIGDLCGGDG